MNIRRHPVRQAQPGVIRIVRRKKEFRRKLTFSFMGIVMLGLAGPVLAQDPDVRKELEMMKERIQVLEGMLKAQQASREKERIETEEKWKLKISELEAQLKTQERPVAGGHPQTTQEILEKRFGSLSIHGGAVGYYQGRNDVRYDDGEDFGNPDGFGIAADLELGFEPVAGGEFVMRLHFGEGDGADKDVSDRLFANLNTIADDNPGDDQLSLLDAFYTQLLFDDKLFVSGGKTEPLVFMDDNAYANDEVAQFVGKPFVNDPVLDSEDEYGPLLAVGFTPSETFSVVVVVQSSSWPLLDAEAQKSKYEKVFNQPFFGAQAAYSTEVLGRKGHYRVYGWTQTYDHPKIKGKGTEAGWGLGLSLDQEVTDKLGLFARAGYHNDDVYDVPFSWSVGTSLKGFIPGREGDELGFGIAGLHGNDDLPADDEDLRDDGVELHLELYYRLAISDAFAITPDVQYVMNPLGNDGNKDIFAGMLRAEWGF